MGFNTVPLNPFPPSSDQRGGGGGGSYVLPVAADDTLGGIKVGDNLTIEEDGTLNAPDPYELPAAADDTLGGIKVGDNLTIEEDGTLNAPDPYELPAATANTLGGVKVGTGLSINDGVLSASGGYSETAIYTGDGTSQPTYALTQPITNFDLIGVRFLRSNNIELYNIYPVGYLNSLISSGHITGAATNDKWCFFGVTDVSNFYRGDESDLHIVEILGINV